MNRGHLWKFLLIVFVVIWAIFEIIPPTSRPLFQEFQGQARRPDETFTAMLNKAKQLDEQAPNRTYANLKEAIGTNELAKYFPQFSVKGQKEPNTFILHQIQREAAGKIHLGLDL